MAQNNPQRDHRILEGLKDTRDVVRSWGLATLAGAALSTQMRALLAHAAERERYYIQAQSLGYGRRDAMMVLYGVMHMARQELRPIDVYAEARSLMVSGELPKPDDGVLRGK